MCGIVGIYNSEEASTLVYLGLYALQHRGQEGVGIVTYHDSKMTAEKGVGLVSEVFSSKNKLNRLKGRVAIGHNRYSTYGDKNYTNIQPLVFNYKGYQIAIAHNGNLINVASITKELEEKGAIFQTTSDTECIIHLFAHSHEKTVEGKMLDALRNLQGAYSLIILVNDKLIVARDKCGIRPLCIGKLDDTLIFASETCALDLIGANYIRDVNPGEMIYLDGNEERSYKIGDPQPRHCIFEYVYFSRPDSRIFGEYVDKTRRKIGKNLALEKPVADADIIISIPDSSNTIALGYAQRSSAKYEIGLIRNHYIGRTFIHPTQEMRDFGVRIKFNPIGGVINQRKVVIVDDSIVRGTTLKKLVRMIRETTQPAEIHIRIGSPPVKHPCFYGMDFPSEQELIANNKNIEEIRTHLEVDSLGYISVEGLIQSTSLPADHFCTACFTGEYVDFDDNAKEME